MGTPFDVNFVDIAFARHSEQVPSALALAMLVMRDADGREFRDCTTRSMKLFFLGSGFLVGFEEGLLDVGGDELVAAEGHGEGTAAAGEGAQGGAVAVHLGQGGLGFQRGVLAFSIHAHDDGAATLQVGHDATLCLGGNGDGDVVDRLLDLGVSLLVLWLRTPLN